MQRRSHVQRGRTDPRVLTWGFVFVSFAYSLYLQPYFYLHVYYF